MIRRKRIRIKRKRRRIKRRIKRRIYRRIRRRIKMPFAGGLRKSARERLSEDPRGMGRGDTRRKRTIWRRWKSMTPDRQLCH